MLSHRTRIVSHSGTVEPSISKNDTESAVAVEALASPMQSCTIDKTFTCFPRIAIELRLKIWKEASNHTRNICLSFMHLGHFFQDDYAVDGFEDSRFKAFIYEVACPHPPILHTCHESRIEGLKNYVLDFGIELKDPKGRFTFNSPPTTYINWKADRICLTGSLANIDEVGEPHQYALDFIDRCRQRGLQSIALNVTYRSSYNHAPNPVMQALSDGSIPLKEVLLFLAEDWFIYQEVIKKKRAVLELPINLDRTLQQTLSNDGRYWKRGSPEWDHIYLEDLQGTETALRIGFDEYEKSLRGEEVGSAATSSWTRPNVHWCNVELKELPQKTAKEHGA
ncbi:hypothetical protein V8E51_018240 [Hyaloscypha variabilis]